MIIAALFTIGKIWKQPKCPSVDEWIKKMSHTHTHTHTHWNITQPSKNEILPIARTQMELEYIMLSEICHAEKELYDLTHMWNLRNKTEDHREQVGKIKQGKVREGDKP